MCRTDLGVGPLAPCLTTTFGRRRWLVEPPADPTNTGYGSLMGISRMGIPRRRTEAWDGVYETRGQGWTQDGPRCRG